MDSTIRVVNSTHFQNYVPVSYDRIRELKGIDTLNVGTNGKLFLKKDYYSFLTFIEEDIIYIYKKEGEQEFVLTGDIKTERGKFDITTNSTTGAKVINMNSILSVFKIQLPAKFRAEKIYIKNTNNDINSAIVLTLKF